MKRKPLPEGRPPRTAWSKILVPTDFSEPSLSALHYARELARECDAGLILLHVVEPFHADWRMDTTTLQRAAHEQARHRLKELAARELTGTRVTTELRSGHPAEQINTVARRHRADVIVIATHGRSGLQHVLLGSVAERVVRHAPCAVLVIRGSLAK